MEPVLAVFAGYTLNHDHVTNSEALAPYVQQALEEIEYVTGDANTKWGAQRVKDGYPNPFPLRYVEIGNEDFFDRSGSYEWRFAQFFDAIRAKYPQSTKSCPTGPASRAAWPHLNRRALLANPKEAMRKPSALIYATNSRDRNRSQRKFSWANGPPALVRLRPAWPARWATRPGCACMERNADIVLMPLLCAVVRQRQPTHRQRPFHAVGQRPDRIRCAHQLWFALVLRAKDVQPGKGRRSAGHHGGEPADVWAWVQSSRGGGKPLDQRCQIRVLFRHAGQQQRQNFCQTRESRRYGAARIR